MNEFSLRVSLCSPSPFRNMCMATEISAGFVKTQKAMSHVTWKQAAFSLLFIYERFGAICSFLVFLW